MNRAVDSLQNKEKQRGHGIAFHHGQYLYPSEGLHDRQAATGSGAALEFEDCANVRIEGCEIGYVGEYGLYFKNGCSDSTLTKSHLHDLGGGGVRIGETERPEEGRVCRKIVVDNCILKHGGRLHPSACAVVLTHAQQCAVTHCDIVLDIYPRWAGGTFRIGFNLMTREGADGFFEMRVKNGKFAAGPYLRWQGGKLVANNTTSVPLGDLTPGQWIRIEIEAKTSAGKYTVTLTKPDGTKQEFKELPCKPTWSEASYLLFSGLSTKDTAYFIDNLSLVPVVTDPVAP